jgi:alpha-L-fucosidase
MLKEVGVWMRRNGAGIYGSRSWSRLGEGEMVNGELKRLPGGSLGRRQAEFKFNETDFRFTVGKDGALYVYCLTVPAAGTGLAVRSLGLAENLLGRPIKGVRLLGSRAKLKWTQEPDGLYLVMPNTSGMATALGFKIE